MASAAAWRALLLLGAIGVAPPPPPDRRTSNCPIPRGPASAGQRWWQRRPTRDPAAATTATWGAAAAALVTSDFTFCSLDPALRISSGAYAFGQSASDGSACLAAAVYDVNTPRIDMDVLLEDFTAEVGPRPCSCGFRSYCCALSLRPPHAPCALPARAPPSNRSPTNPRLFNNNNNNNTHTQVTFSQTSFYRDTQVCGRVQAEPGETYKVTHTPLTARHAQC